MAIAFDSVQVTTFGTNRTTTHTVGASADRILIVHFGAVTDTATAVDSSVDGAFTFLNEGTYPGGAYEGLSAWYLINPTTGVHTISVTHTGSGRMDSISYSGVNQSNPIDSSDVNNNAVGTTSLTTSTTVVGSDCWLVGTVSDSGAATAAGAGTTLRAQSADTGHTVGDSGGTVGTGSQSLIFTCGTANLFRGIILSLAPTGGSVTHNLTLLGVGT